MKSIFSLLFVMCLGIFSFSQTVDVTFRVDMQYQNVSPNGVDSIKLLKLQNCLLDHQ